MSRINNALIAFISLIVLSGCSVKEQPVIQAAAPNGHDASHIKTVKNSVDMSGVDESALFMASIEALSNLELDRAATYMETLYKTTAKKQYLAELVKIYSAKGDLDKVGAILEEIIKSDDNNLDAKRMLAANYMGQKEYAKAFELIVAVADKSKVKADYDMAGSVAFVVGDYKAAQKYFRLSYGVKADHVTAERIATIMFLENRGAEATAFLDTHTRMFGCSKYICERLAKAYIERGDKKGALDTYKKLYFKLKDEKYIKSIIELSVAGSDIDGLITFLKKTQKDDNLLFEAYKYKKDNKNAAATAMKLYAKTKDLNYLAQAVIYKFESHPEKKPLWLIKESVKNLEIVTGGMQNDIYDNYLGYLLIDYNLDVARGIELVKRALAKDPTSLFYKDSLAWGYYKQKKCAEANELMKSVAAELKDDKTVIEHAEAIKKCLQGQK